jgi:hypothetical protein
VLKLTPSSNKRADRGIVEPLSAERFRVHPFGYRAARQFTANQELKDKLELAADLMAHRNPSRDFAPIVDKALDLLIAELKKERFGQTTRPQHSRKASTPSGIAKARPERVTNATKRKVFERDGMQCAFVDEDGKRCSARAFLERDHRALPAAKEADPIPITFGISAEHTISTSRSSSSVARTSSTQGPVAARKLNRDVAVEGRKMRTRPGTTAVRVWIDRLDRTRAS